MAGVPPKRAEVFNWETTLTSQADTNIDQVNPTIAAGDVIVYQDGVLDGNIDTTPTPIGASAIVACTLSVAEMTADRIFVHFHDAVGAEWQDRSWEFFTVLKDMDDVATQAEILVDATPFAGGNVDVAVSTRATQAQILSDATPFPGANVDMAISACCTQGPGAEEVICTTLSDVDGSPIDAVAVWVTTDIAGANIIASGLSDALGQVIFWLNVGTYYVWRSKIGIDFSATNPDTEVVT